MNNGTWPFVSTSWAMIAGTTRPANRRAASHRPLTSLVRTRASHSPARRDSGTRLSPSRAAAVSARNASRSDSAP